MLHRTNMKTLRNMICLVIIAVCVLWTAAVGGQVRLQFDQPEADLEMANLRKPTAEGESVFLAAIPIFPSSVGPASPVINLTVDLPVGETRVQVTVRNAHGWSELSEPLLVVVPPSWSLQGDIITTSDGSRIRIWPEFSNDLDRWRPLPFPGGRFTRVAVAAAETSP
jgi:hypothetical protein